MVNVERVHPTRVLHVVGAMDRGGTETWLLHVLRHTDRSQIAFDFLVHTARPGAYDDEVRQAGGRLIPCLSPARPWQYARNFRRILQQFGPYDVVHSHVHHFSGLPLLMAQWMGVPMRIAHSHLDTSRTASQLGLTRRQYQRGMEALIRRSATVGLAVSREAASALFGPDWQLDPRYRVLPCGIDLAAFEHRTSTPQFCLDLDLPSDAFVVGHVGRFVEQKNHRFIIGLAAELCRQYPDIYFLLIGVGPKRDEVERLARAEGIAEQVILPGSRPDVPELLMHCMDAFVLPSLYEGLPLALMEVQAAGLPSVITNTVPVEADVVPELVVRLPLDDPGAWVEEILRIRQAVPAVSAEQCLDAIRHSSFNIQTSVDQLLSLYG